MRGRARDVLIPGTALRSRTIHWARMTESTGSPQDLCIVVVFGQRQEESHQRAHVVATEGHVAELGRRVAQKSLARQLGAVDIKLHYIL